ncbi:hypothetical protein GOHSU_14_00820 [Gordonia hirsuta DSM 44140 = NBRC 16056]|uniref:Tat pathway signal protein n=1 Tax=Gordonia hirsuta DSM 44140 = NBRC 16056 TaxID=1121927 RepID=L7L6Y9_9ACTN|nr:hypothetical protein [Gordonia hirsuta]GAC56915.1 hypothetical protein GOHSU_14_00820 [Gordonia hirsuta DSM 44140 = NBRC 16056]
MNPRTRRRTGLLRGAALAVAAALTLSGTALITAPATAAGPLQQYLDLPTVNRDAAHGPGGIHPALPTDVPTLRKLVDEARASGVAPTSYRALLLQYWLASSTKRAGIDLKSWNPRAGVTANRGNLIKSYRYYEDLQLAHRELQWSGMAGMVGADFGGGLADFELATNVFEFARLQPIANAIVTETNRTLGPVFVDKLPEGLRALARVGAVISPADLRKVQADILVMQKNIFTDLMPQHRAYIDGGLPALREMYTAGLMDDQIMRAWEQIASKEPSAVAAGNARLLQREQGEVIKDQWDAVRNYKGDVGMALTYATTVAGSPSVAGVVPPRSFHPLKVSGTLADGRTAVLTLPLATWNWSVYPERWEYITEQLLPKYKYLVDHNWASLRAQLSVPYETQFESHRPIWNIAPTLQSALDTMKVEIK